MNRAAVSCLSIVMLSWLGVASDRAYAFEDGYGSISGQFVLEGEIPEPAILVKKGDAQAKDAAVCAAEDIKSETLVVDPASKGIANIFVFMRKAPKVHPSLKESQEKTVEFDQKGCQFIPHALLVRTDQVVLVKSADPISHNTHTFPLRNSANNLTIPGNERKGVEFIHKAPESFPTQVKCDIHPWMIAHWLILDHPYAAVTDKEGKFTIDKLPVGTHDFLVWQEQKGWVNAGERRGFKVKVESNGNTDLGTIKISVADLAESK